MRDEDKFHSWLQLRRGHQRNTANSKVGRVKSCESYFGVDLETAAAGGSILGMIEQIKVRSDLTKNTKDSYASALRRYAEFHGN